MADIAELRTRREALVAQHIAFIDKAEAEDRGLTDAEKVEDDKIVGQIGELDKRIDAQVKTAAIRQRPSESTGRPSLGHPEANPANIEKPKAKRPRHGGSIGPYKDEESAYKSGLFLMATCGHPDNRARAQEMCRSEGVEYQAALGSANPTQGAAFIFDEFSAAVIDMAEEFGIYRRYARNWPMNSATLIAPRLTGGVTAYAVGEVEAATESNPTSDIVTLVAKDWATLTAVPRDLMEDSAIPLAVMLAKEIGLAFATKEDTAGFIGDGTSTYHGIVGLTTALNQTANAASVYTAISGNITFDTLDLVDFQSVVGKFPMYPGARPAWFISKAGWAASMMRLAMAQGGATAETVASGTGATFLGYPVVFTPNGVLHTTLTSSVSTIHCLFGDLSMSSAMGIRRGVSVESDSSVYFTTRRIAVQGFERFDIVNHTIVDPRNSSNAGPILALKTPGS